MLIRHLRLGAVLLGLVSAGVLAPPSLAHAAGPMVKTQAPGYYRLMVGAIEVTALSDGTVALPMTKLLTKVTPEAAQKALARSFLKDPVETSVNAFLINTGTKLVLVDTGAAGLFGPTLGKLQASLKAAGYSADQVDEVYITHLHPDHVGGLMAGEALAFPNAVVRADRHDADFWLSQAHLDQAPTDKQGFFKGAMASLNPYVAAGRFKPFDGDTPLVPGVRAQLTGGHTPGHSFFVIESQGEKLVLWGDVMHAGELQFSAPEITIAFDSDPELSADVRAKAYADAAEQGYLVAGAHLSFPGLGRLRAAPGGAYVFIPVNYRSVP
jgi:glyoxylase-like metal-dependent hydrolase (beta-lactamase superfamily II)